MQCGTTTSNGGAEAFIELQKSLNQLGDYRLTTPVNTIRWGQPSLSATGALSARCPQESDYMYYSTSSGSGAGNAATVGTFAAAISNQAGNMGSHCFAMATSLETSNGIEISGLNAEEQSDISLIVTYTAAQQSTFNFETYVYYDAMLVLRENNVLELIQ